MNGRSLMSQKMFNKLATTRWRVKKVDPLLHHGHGPLFAYFIPFTRAFLPFSGGFLHFCDWRSSTGATALVSLGSHQYSAPLSDASLKLGADTLLVTFRRVWIHNGSENATLSLVLAVPNQEHQIELARMIRFFGFDGGQSGPHPGVPVRYKPRSSP